MSELQLTIGFSGAAGTGKTTLAELYAKRNDLPIVRLETKTIMERHKLYSHYDVMKLMATPTRGIKFQEDLIYERCELFDKATRPFVSDRLPLDSYLYYLCQFAWADDEDNTKILLDTCLKSFHEMDFNVSIPFGALPPAVLGNDPKRITNKYWHLMFDAAMSEHVQLCMHEAPRFKHQAMIIIPMMFRDNPTLDNNTRISLIETCINQHQSRKSNQIMSILNNFEGTMQ